MTSSSEEDTLNPDIRLRDLVSITVEHADGSQEHIPVGGLAFDAGGNVNLDVADDAEEIIWSVDVLSGGEDPYYRQKYEGLIGIQEGLSSSGDLVDSERPAWLFTDESMHVTTINNTAAEVVTGSVFILGDTCITLGEFEDPYNPGYPEIAEQSSSSEGGALSVLNICIPCVDCLHYKQLEEWLDRLRSFYDYVFALSYDNDTSTIPSHPDGEVVEQRTGLLQQLLSAQRYWDFLIHRTSVKLGAQAYGQSLVAAGFYRNISDRTIGAGLPDGVTLTFLFTFQRVDDAGAVTAWDGITESVSDVKVLDRSSKCSSVLGTTGVSFIGSNQVQVETVSGRDLASGQEIYSDVALILLSTVLANDPTYGYRVSVQLTVSHTHLGPAVSANAIVKNESVYFRPPDPEPSS